MATQCTLCPPSILDWVTNFYVTDEDDASVLCSYLMPRLMESRHYTPRVPDFIISDIIITLILVRDPSYPLLPWMMKPHKRQLDCWKEHYSYCLSRCHVTAECPFSHLKACW